LHGRTGNENEYTEKGSVTLVYHSNKFIKILQLYLQSPYAGKLLRKYLNDHMMEKNK